MLTKNDLTAALAQGYSFENTVNLRVNRPRDVLQRQLVFQPCGETRWRTHPDAAFSRPLLEGKS